MYSTRPLCSGGRVNISLFRLVYSALISIDRAKLDGCILGKGTKIGGKAELKQCITQAGYEVDAGGEHTSLPLYLNDDETFLGFLSSRRLVQERKIRSLRLGGRF